MYFCDEIQIFVVFYSLLEIDLLHQKKYSTQSLSDMAKVIIFVTDCSSFNIITNEKRGETQLHQSLDLYKTIRNNKYRIN